MLIRRGTAELIDNKRRYMVEYKQESEMSIKFHHESQLNCFFNWLFILIFNIHTQVKYMRRELNGYFFL